MLSWWGIVRLGLVQMALGAVVVLTTSTLNRVMVIELALPALLPGALVALHYVVQLSRPTMGYGSDVWQRRTPWIVGGMTCLSAGGALAAASVVWMTTRPGAGMALAAIAFALIGLGVSAAGTSLLALLAKHVAPARRGAAAAVVWMMMIAGFAVTAGLAGHFLDPYSAARLLVVASTVSALAWLLAVVALAGLERGITSTPAAPATATETETGLSWHAFGGALAQVWREPQARHFTIFVFVSMLAYSSQDLILEPFAGAAFGMTPGQSTQLAGVQHGGVLLGMVAVALATAWGARHRQHRFGPAMASLRGWTLLGCAASALALLALVAAGAVGPAWPLRPTVFALGVANGAFSIGAIGSMMMLADQGRRAREGTRMGLWGAAQAMAFALGGLVGTGAADLARALWADPGTAYASVFAMEAMLFALSAWLAMHITSGPAAAPATRAYPHHPALPAQGDHA
jgi:BCD family chlorophyll transporter-like MFS transporter